jgi:hypothetical protein
MFFTKPHKKWLNENRKIGTVLLMKFLGNQVAPKNGWQIWQPKLTTVEL